MICDLCGKEFHPKEGWHRWCSDQCAAEGREEDALEEDAMRNMGLDDAVDFGLGNVGNK